MRFLIPLIIAAAFMSVFFQNCAGRFETQSQKVKERPEITETNPVFKPYIQEFNEYYGLPTWVPVGFATLEEGIAGTCWTTKVGGVILSAYIEIDSEYWFTISELQKRNLIIHELGHCVLDRDDIPLNSVEICPSSFMSERIMYDFCLEQHFDEYVKEMFD